MTSTRTSEQPGPTRSRPGGRSARVRAGVLAAARELVAEQGYEPVSIEQIAARAGVHKTTVYRRWPTKARLVMDAVEDMSAERVPVPDTGALASDLRRFSRAIVANRQVGLCVLCHSGPFPELRFHSDLAPDLTGVGSRDTGPFNCAP